MEQKLPVSGEAANRDAGTKNNTFNKHLTGRTMNLIQSFIQKGLSSIGFNLVAKNGQTTLLLSDESKLGKSGSRIVPKLRIERNYYSIQGQESLKVAIQIAENVELPNRDYLYEIYKDAIRDLHLQSQIRTSIIKVIQEPAAMVDKKTGKIDIEATELITNKFFEDISRFYLEAEFWGHSLIEFGQLVDKGNGGLEVGSVILIPRQHVRPEFGLILIRPGDISGLEYRNPPFNNYLIEAGDPYDLGLLQYAAKYSIYKKFSVSDWSLASEKWGMPLTIIKTDTSEDTELDKIANWASNLGTNGYGIFGKDDEVDTLERKNDNGEDIFKAFIELMNDENSKGVNGQTGTTDQKAFVGSAEVHERLLDDYTESRLRQVMHFNNDIVLPKLIGLNNGNTLYSKLKGKTWKPLRFMKELKDPNELPDPNESDPTNGNGGGQKKKPRIP